MGSVTCPSGDHAENAGECLTSNPQQFKLQILPTITFNPRIILTQLIFCILHCTIILTMTITVHPLFFIWFSLPKYFNFVAYI